MNITKKPIKKCNGCELNFRRCCGVYEIPRLMWERGKCPGYGNEEMAMKYRASCAQHLEAREAARRKRCEVQALRKTESHHAGHQYTLVSCDKPSDRKKSTALHANYITTGKHSSRIGIAVAHMAQRQPKRTSPRTLR